MQEIVTLACEKWTAGDKVNFADKIPTALINSGSLQPPSARDNEKCANQIANNLSKKFGPGWNAVVGEAFSFEISFTKYVNQSTTSVFYVDFLRATLLYMYFGGHLGIAVWRTSQERIDGLFSESYEINIMQSI